MSWLYVIFIWVGCTDIELVLLYWVGCTHAELAVRNWLYALVVILKRVDQSYNQFKCVNKDKTFLRIFSNFTHETSPFFAIVHTAHFLFFLTIICLYICLSIHQFYPTLSMQTYLSVYLTTYSTEELSIYPSIYSVIHPSNVRLGILRSLCTW